MIPDPLLAMDGIKRSTLGGVRSVQQLTPRMLLLSLICAALQPCGAVSGAAILGPAKVKGVSQKYDTFVVRNKGALRIIVEPLSTPGDVDLFVYVAVSDVAPTAYLFPLQPLTPVVVEPRE